MGINEKKIKIHFLYVYTYSYNTLFGILIGTVNIPKLCISLT